MAEKAAAEVFHLVHMKVIGKLRLKAGYKLMFLIYFQFFQDSK